MPKPTNRSRRTKPTKRTELTSDVVVERNTRRAVKRQKNIRRLQRQLQRELAASRRAMTDLIEWLVATGYADAPAAPPERE